MPVDNLPLPSPSPSLPLLNHAASSPTLRRFEHHHQQTPLIPHDADAGDVGASQLELKHDELVQIRPEFEPQHECSDSYESDIETPPEYAFVDLQTIRKEVQCPICLGIIKKTRTVMECLHRFCRECIDKSMRMGNNECPACRTHCPSRRSLRDDPRFDAIIAALYPDVKKFEEEDLAFCEEEETRNKQIQESIAEVLRKQTEVVGKKRHTNTNAANPSTLGNFQNTSSKKRRRRRRKRNTSPNYQDSDDNNGADESDKQLDTYELHSETKQRKGKGRESVGSSHSPSTTPLKNNEEESNERRRSFPGLICTTEMLSWGKGGVRSNTRSCNGGVSKNARRIRLDKLVDFLRSLEDNDEEYVALQTSIQAENVKALGIPDCNVSIDQQHVHHSLPCSKNKISQRVISLEERLHLLEQRRTLPGAVGIPISNGEQLIHAAYQQKQAM